MDYLITGATGFIGRQLVGQLLALGHEVNYLGRKRSRTMDSRAAFHCWTLEQLPPLDSISRLDAIIHLAGEPIMQRWAPEVKRRIRASRVESTRNLVSAIGTLRHKPQVLVSASAIGYYGDRGDEILTETSAPGADFLARVCIDWESEADRARGFGVRVVTIRNAIVLGTHGGALKKMLRPFRMGLGGRFGDGRQWMSWIHVDDLVRLLICAVENSAMSGPVNGGSPDPVTNAELTRTLGRVLHRPAVLPVPKLVLKLAFGEVGEVMLGSQRVLPAAAQRNKFDFQYPDLGTALESLLD
ncbi:MAG: TIGR01777 family oxidoreductase [Acidobacteriaceae bacterium]|nr:TIGR01777 family oxidoreductase [Acidobacteriaceae bacterium]